MQWCTIDLHLHTPASGDFQQPEVTFLDMLQRAEARLLEDYLHQGGGLVFFLGDQVQPENYNRQLGGADALLLRRAAARM